VEIERKFLVDAVPDDLDGRRASSIEQGYVAIDPDGTEVRIRRRDGTSTLTVKSGGGLARVEEELAIDDAAFERLWPLTAGRRIEKVRHVIPTDIPGVEIELDEYRGDLDGLLVAEVEFPGEDEAHAFTPPPWFGADVTDDRRFKNQRLAVDGRPA
jgi:CYTH domain-containing protein